MSIFFPARSRGVERALGDTSSQIVPPRSGGGGPTSVSAADALRHSTVWACLQLRSNLMSAMPVDQYTGTGANRREVTKGQLLTQPGALHLGGQLATFGEWLGASQIDLDRYGNAFGMIVARDSLMRPTRIDLVDASTVTVRVRQGLVTYLIGGKTYDTTEVWHERQFILPGQPVGLSPIAYAACAVQQYLSAQEFARAWFSSGGVPSAVMKNTLKTISPTAAADMKERVKATQAAGDVLVVGNDWDYTMVSVPANQAAFIEAQQFSVADVCRFFNVPADLIGASQSGSSITYANITQRMLQFLVVHFGPSVKRREDALSGALASPQFAKLNTDAILRLDPIQRGALFAQQLTSKQRVPSEVRALDNLPPFTPEQEDEMARLYGKPASTPVTSPAPEKGVTS